MRRTLVGCRIISNPTKLEKLNLKNNPELTKAQIAELQKALPKCNISSNPVGPIAELQKALPKCSIFSNPTK